MTNEEKNIAAAQENLENFKKDFENLKEKYPEIELEIHEDIFIASQLVGKNYVNLCFDCSLEIYSSTYSTPTQNQQMEGHEMSEEQINIAIAEACGWTDCSNIDGTLCGLPIGVTSLNGRYEIIPDYCNDLNAIAMAEISLTADQWYKYDSMMPLRDPQKIHATARQRAKAFLKTIGKWEEKK